MSDQGIIHESDPYLIDESDQGIIHESDPCLIDESDQGIIHESDPCLIDESDQGIIHTHMVPQEAAKSFPDSFKKKSRRLGKNLMTIR